MQICLAPKPALFAFLWPCSSSFCLVSTVSSHVYSLFLNDYDTFRPFLLSLNFEPHPQLLVDITYYLTETIEGIHQKLLQHYFLHMLSHFSASSLLM